MASESSIFDFTEYRAYLAEVLKPSGASRGMRARLATHLGCQSAFVSQVLHGKAELSLEHALLTSQFLGHSEHESHFFMLMVQMNRAGHTQLRDYYHKQIKVILRGRQQVRERIQVHQALGSEYQNRYYSSWIYSAVHIMLSVPQYQSKEALAAQLHLPMEVVSETLDFLLECGLVEKKGHRYQIGTRRIHLSSGSELLPKHHINWRMQAIKSLDFSRVEDLHYSSVISLSRADAKKIGEMILSLLEKTEPILVASPEEEVYGFTVDYFKL